LTLPNNLLTVVRANGSEQTYDPRRQQGVSVYRTEEKAFSVGDRIQFTAPANAFIAHLPRLLSSESFPALANTCAIGENDLL